MHTLIIFNPGHFHAALALRYRHRMLSNGVYVYAEDGPDLERFLALVETFNRRENDPAQWNLHVYRGADCLERLIAERKGGVVIVAGKNDRKLDSIARLQAAGFSVLGDKPWLIDSNELPRLEHVAGSEPVAMDIMTERHDPANRLQRALSKIPSVFGEFLKDGSRPAISMVSVHHLLKTVNGQPLKRPVWYFDTAIQGEGITDVTTHLADLALWLTDRGEDCVYDRDIELIAARQWPTSVPLEIFSRITGLPDFPDGFHRHVHHGCLNYLCNARIEFALRGVLTHMEARWDLQVRPGGGDLHEGIVRGSLSEIVVEQSAETGFLSQLTILPKDPGKSFGSRLAQAVAELQVEFPGLSVEKIEGGYRALIPSALRTTHEQHFSVVLSEFLEYADGRKPASHGAADVMAKYALLARAKTLSSKAPTAS
ncbi:MAG: putative oxidoreductase C-terminal domain-containing protein [Burkholderiales bacterium]